MTSTSAVGRAARTSRTTVAIDSASFQAGIAMRTRSRPTIGRALLDSQPQKSQALGESSRFLLEPTYFPTQVDRDQQEEDHAQKEHETHARSHAERFGGSIEERWKET